MLKIIFIELLSYLSPLLFIAVLELISRKIGAKRHIPETIVRRRPGSTSGWGTRSPRTADREKDILTDMDEE